jgi:hypothetical protein
MTNPSWFEHVDLMQLIIALLILIVGWFAKRDITRIETKIVNVCSVAGTKVDKKDNEDEHEQLWKRINHHSHTENGKVVLTE